MAGSIVNEIKKALPALIILAVVIALMIIVW